LYRFLRVRSLQAKILALFVLLIVVVQVGGFILINTAGISAAANRSAPKSWRERVCSIASSGRTMIDSARARAC